MGRAPLQAEVNPSQMKEVNGRYYPLWQQFLDQKIRWIGGALESRSTGTWDITKITDIDLTPHYNDSAWFEVKGEKFSCGFDVRHGGIGSGENGYITFHLAAGEMFRIKEKEWNEQKT